MPRVLRRSSSLYISDYAPSLDDASRERRAHMARQGGNGNEGTTGDESTMAGHGTRPSLMNTDEYIESLSYHFCSGLPSLTCP